MPAEPSAAPMRADARRNHQRVLDAARELMEERGYGVEMCEIAAAAGVGVGTIYRRFQDKRALVHAVLEAKFALMVERADALLGGGLGPWERLERFVRLNTLGGDEREPADVAFGFAVSEHTNAALGTAGLQDRLDRLVRDAVGAGAARPGLRWEDLVSVMASVGHVRHRGAGFPGDPERLLELLLDGMRAR